MVTLEASFGSHKSVQAEYLELNVNRLHAFPNPSGKENTLEDGLKKMRFWLDFQKSTFDGQIHLFRVEG